MNYRNTLSLFTRKAVLLVLVCGLLVPALASLAQTRRLLAHGNMQRWNEERTFGIALLMKNIQVSEGETIVSTDPNYFGYYEFDVTNRKNTSISPAGPFEMKWSPDDPGTISFTTTASRMITTGTVAEGDIEFFYDSGTLTVTMTDNREFGDLERAPDEAIVEYVPNDPTLDGNSAEGDFEESGFTVTVEESVVEEGLGAGTFRDASGATVEFNAHVKSTTSGAHTTLEGTTTLRRKARSGMAGLTLLSTRSMQMMKDKKTVRVEGTAEMTDTKGRRSSGSISLTLTDGEGTKRSDSLRILFRPKGSRFPVLMESNRIKGDITVRKR